MDVILKEDVQKLGAANQVVKVRDGYARNYLIPKGLAVQATESNRKNLGEIQRQQAHRVEKQRKAAQSTEEKLKDIKLTIGAKVGETGKIYGSVTNIQIAEALRQKGIEVDRKLISFEEDHIKQVGTYNATINLYKDVKVTIPFEVVAE